MSSDPVPVMVVPRDPDGNGVCRYRKCRVRVDAEAMVLIANGGEVMCQQCMAEIIEKHPGEVRDSPPV